MKSFAALSAVALSGAVAQNATCSNSTFTSISASEAFAGLNPGWNLGNTLEAVPDEGSWNNPKVQPVTFDDIKASGFKSIRIPVTWADHFVADEAPYTVQEAWMDRVEEVVDEVLDRGLYAILNAHGDAYLWADVTQFDIPTIEAKFGSLWSQIGKRFACKSSKLIFEPLNEPVGYTQTAGDELNKLNDIFLKAINDAGGNNPKRVVSLSGLGMDGIKTSLYFKRGDSYPSQPWGIQFHYYSPYDFIFGAWAKTIWGSDADKTALTADFDNFHGNFTDIPAFIGEYDASSTYTEPAARWKYFDYLISTAKSYNYSTIVWDNGLDQFDRTLHTWRDPTVLSILTNASAGTANTLADSTEDGSATSQNSSAYMFHKVGAEVTDQTATYVLNRNTFKSISSSGSLLSSADYTFADSTLTLKASYLSSLLTSAAPGIVANLTLTFSAGADLELQIVQWDQPTLPTTSFTASSSDMTVPIEYKGLKEVAAVRAYKADGTYLADDWTEYLGPLQRAGWTYGNWNFDDQGLVVAGSGGSAILSAGMDVTLVVDFYPRILGENTVNVTVTV
ncbi:MAG: hypothetical protein MMC23_007413 [Stictis urceolatum]|nr:hypothetical protein [Stictis urceolata]